MNTLQYAILGILTYISLNGYSLKKIFDKSINQFWHASLSQIYKELGELERSGYVTSTIQEQDERPDKRVYSITAGGGEAFLTWLNRFPTPYASPKRDEFALRIFFGGRLEKAVLRKHLEGFIEERKKFIEEMIEGKQKVNEILRAASLAEGSENMGMVFIRRRAEITNQALIEWAEECLQALDEDTVYKGENQ